jgi:hypothetical protein
MLLEIPRDVLRLVLGHLLAYESVPLWFVCKEMASFLKKEAKHPRDAAETLAQESVLCEEPHLIKWLFAKKFRIPKKFVYYIAATKGAVGFLKWLDENQCPTCDGLDLESIAKLAAQDGRLEVLKLIFPRFVNKGNFSRKVIYAAATNQQIAVLNFIRDDYSQWLKRHHLVDAFRDINFSAHPRSVRWLRENGIRDLSQEELEKMHKERNEELEGARG